MALKLDMVGIATKDMAASLRFYRLLGLPIPAGKETEPHVEFQAEGYRLAWDTHAVLEAVYGEWEPKPRGHRIELAFLCDSAAAVDETYRRITEAGYRGHKAPWDAFWGQRYAVLLDPDGNLVSLFAPL